MNGPARPRGRGRRALVAGLVAVALAVALLAHFWPSKTDGPGIGRVVSFASLIKPEAKKSFAAFERSIPGKVGIAVAPTWPGPTLRFGSFQRGHAWSSIKVAILVTLLRDRASAGLTREEREWALAALSRSDNFTAALLFHRLEEIHGGFYPASRAMQKVLAKAGDTETTVATDPPPSGAFSTYGQTRWSLEGSVRFYRALVRGELLNRTDTAYVLRLMEGSDYWEPWGLREAGFPRGVRIAAKSGWGTEGSDEGPYLLRQVGVLRTGASAVVVTIMVQDDSGSLGAAVRDLNLAATWLRRHLMFPFGSFANPLRGGES
jgi:beta-lactamase family protein